MIDKSIKIKNFPENIIIGTREYPQEKVIPAAIKIMTALKEEMKDKSYTISELKNLLKEYNKEHYYYVLHGDDCYTPENFLNWLKKKEEK